MRKPSKGKFETVPISEVRKKALAVDEPSRVRKTVHKEEPYAVTTAKAAAAANTHGV